MKQYVLLLCFICVAGAAQAQVPQHIFFENSELPYGFARSVTNYQGSSWVRNYAHQLPVSNAVFFTPPNALELTYTSSQAGNWTVDVYTNASNGLRVDPQAHLYIRIRLPLNMPEEALPDLQLLQEDQQNTQAIELGSFLRKNPDGPWSRIEIPLHAFKGFDEDKALLALRFMQSSASPQTYTLYLDQVEILPARLPNTKLTGAAVLASVKAYPRHAVLKWKLPLTPSIRYIQIYRSTDNKTFTPIAIRPAPQMYYTDILPDTSQSYYYKIAWLDYDFQRSPFSQVKSLRSAAMDSGDLLEMVQKAHIRYYLAGEEFNSGMQRLTRRAASTQVSTKGTGTGLMALLVGVRHQMLTRAEYREKVNRICDFLLQAETFQGAFPAVIDGRTGKARSEGEALGGADLEATAYLIQGLLVAREYFQDKSKEDESLRSKIDTLWRNVQWNKFKKEGKHHLYNSWTPAMGFAQARPLSGAASIPVYLLAMASPTHNIDIEDYAQGMAKPLVFQASPGPSLDSVTLQQEALQDTLTEPGRSGHSGRWLPAEYTQRAIYYGIPLNLNKENLHLPELLMAFSGLDPRGKKDAYANYFREIEHLIRIQKRAREENSALPLVLTRGLGGGASRQVDFTSGVASFAFTPEIGLANLDLYYNASPELSWSAYGFKSRLDLEKNRYLHVDDVSYKALVPVMIENGKSGMIWDLFMQVPEITTIMNALFTAD